jgi:quinolinate synthase
MILPEEYQGLGEEELKKRIQAVKDRLGEELVILCHHYQRDDVYNFADFFGDSFQLAQDAAHQEKAKYIVFCGVHFMAEAARILCGTDQHVFLPDMDAGCPMADLANIEEVESAWQRLSETTDVSKIIPITYMNSTAAIKAFCGANGGIVCTSSNAGKLFDWAFERGEKIFFLPDEHLGRNTARAKGFEGEQVVLWNRQEADGGISEEQISKSKVIVWNGFCHVHTRFTVDDVKNARKKYPDAKIIVHPECTENVVKIADASGSTDQIRKYVENAPKDSTVIVGTEINMVSRLANLNKDKKVLPLSRSLCPNMFKISLNDLCWTLEKLGEVNEITVTPEIAENAKKALQRMLDNG